MEACPHPGDSILPGNSTRGKGKGGPYSFSACSNRKKLKVWGQGKQVQGHPGNQQIHGLALYISPDESLLVING